MVHVLSAALTHPGRKRPNNEDYVTFYEPKDEAIRRTSGCIYILADGVGGASNGEMASKYAAEKILYDYYQYPDIPITRRLETIIRNAGNEIFDFAEQQSGFMQMATTVVVAVVREGTLQVAHVGDSRAYILRDNQVNQLTRDHSAVGELMRDGVLTEEEAMHFEGRNPLSRSLGGQRDVRVDVTDPMTLMLGDKILLSSDGFSRYASRDTIQALLAKGKPKEAVIRLIDYANKSGGVDNVSAILVEAVSEAEAVAAATIAAAGAASVAGREPSAPEELDTVSSMPTQYGDANKRRKKAKKAPVLLYAAGFLSVLFLVFFVGRVLLKSFSAEDIQEQAVVSLNNPPADTEAAPTETAEIPVQAPTEGPASAPAVPEIEMPEVSLTSACMVDAAGQPYREWTVANPFPHEISYTWNTTADGRGGRLTVPASDTSKFKTDTRPQTVSLRYYFYNRGISVHALPSETVLQCITPPLLTHECRDNNHEWRIENPNPFEITVNWTSDLAGEINGTVPLPARREGINGSHPFSTTYPAQTLTLTYQVGEKEYQLPPQAVDACFHELVLTQACELVNGVSTHEWTLTNPNSFEIPFNWTSDLDSAGGPGIVSANSSETFRTETQGETLTLTYRINGEEKSLELMKADLCQPPTPVIQTGWCEYVVRFADYNWVDRSDIYFLMLNVFERMLNNDELEAYAAQIVSIEGYDNSAENHRVIEDGDILKLPRIDRELCESRGGTFEP